MNERLESTPKGLVPPLKTFIGVRVGDLLIEGSMGRDSKTQHTFSGVCGSCNTRNQSIPWDTFIKWRDYGQQVRCKSSLCAARIAAEDRADDGRRRDSAKDELREARMNEDLAECPLLPAAIANNPQVHAKVIREYWASKDRDDARAYLQRQEAFVQRMQDSATALAVQTEQRATSAHNAMLRQFDIYAKAMALAGQDAAPWANFREWPAEQQSAMVTRCEAYIAKMRRVKAMSSDQMYELFQKAGAEHVRRGGTVADLDFKKFYEDLTEFD
jgi:hypothetical protein